MADRVTLTQHVYFKVNGQPMLVYAGSTVDVTSSSMFAPSHITNVIAGGGTLSPAGHNQPVANFRAR